ncbi:PRC-barrel domain-containing protein [Roseiterribacter gracilis]|uniref:Photosystem reaction center subunit H n=1 Tax=Roseiterribacter gracilis TaxID=2812848 RepID=A0A8S8XCP6_9PROT|nr:photosystem reaction center subunit H [Rhodospirillales bacterium TMPK1]
MATSTTGTFNTRNGDVPRDETHQLISADKVEGTAVYSSSGERIGAIEDIMIDKRSGKVAYAVLSVGGFLGIGERHHPLPWNALTYNLDLGGYQVAIPVERLKDAPSYAMDEAVDLDDRAYGRKIHDYYGTAPYWDPAI